jgi:hypothetical protein
MRLAQASSDSNHDVATIEEHLVRLVHSPVWRGREIDEPAAKQLVQLKLVEHGETETLDCIINGVR